MSWHIVRKEDDTIEVYNNEDREVHHYVGEAAKEIMRLFDIMYGTDNPEELGNLYGITFQESK